MKRVFFGFTLILILLALIIGVGKNGNGTFAALFNIGTVEESLATPVPTYPRNTNNSYNPVAPGDFVAAITVPVPAKVGVSLAFDGTYLYYTNLSDNNLYKIATDGTLVDTLSIGVNLGAMSWDASRQKLWAGTLDYSKDIYLVDPNSGAIEFQFDAPAGFYNFHDGLAYDASDDTLWFSDDVANTVYHLSTSGDVLNTIPVTFPNSGIAVGGPALYMGSNGFGVIYKVDKANGNVLKTFATPGGRDEDLECDNVTFAPLEVMWSKDAFNNTITAFEVTPGTCQFGIIPGPQGQLQLHMVDALPVNVPIAPSLTIVNEEPAPADYNVVVQLWSGFSMLAEQTQNVSFVWSGKQLLNFDFGVYDPTSYYIWAELWQNDELIEVESHSFSVGLDYLKLYAAVGDLTQAAFTEVNEGEDIAVDALSQAASTSTSEAADFIIDELAEFALKLGGLHESLPQEEVNFAVNELVGWTLNFNEAIELGTYNQIAPYWRNKLDSQVFNSRRAAVNDAESALLSFAQNQTFTWAAEWQAESIRRQAVIQNKNETVGGLGIDLSFEAPFVHKASLVEMKGQFDWIDNTLLPFVDNWSTYVLIGLVLLLIVAVIIILLPTGAPVAILAAAVIAGKAVLLLFPLLVKLFLLLKNSKLVIAFIIMTLFAFSIGDTAKDIVSPEVVNEHQDAMNYLQSVIGEQSGKGPASSLKLYTETPEHNNVFFRTQLGAGGDPSWLETQLYRSDGRLFDIVDHGIAEPGTEMSGNWRLPSGSYWAIAVANGDNNVQAQRSVFQVASPSVTLNVTLLDPQIILGEALDASITITNQDTNNSTGSLVLNAMTLDGEGLKVWLPELGPGASYTYDYTFIPQSEGSYVLRAAVGNNFGKLAREDRSFVVGDASAVGLDYSFQSNYLPGQDIAWTITAVNAGTQITTTLITLNTYDRNTGYTLVYSSSYTATLNANGAATFNMTALPAALPGAYSTQLKLGNELYRTDDYLVDAEGVLFAILNSNPPVVTTSNFITLTANIQNELYNAIDADVMLNIYTPDGSEINVPLTQIGTGSYQGIYQTNASGTYVAEVTATKTNYASATGSTFFSADESSLLLLNTQGSVALNVTTPITFSVYNEYLLPVPGATLIISGTDGLVTEQTNSAGIASLTLHPLTTDPIAVEVVKTGYASTSLHLPVAVISDTISPNLSMVLPSISNETTLTFKGLTEPGAMLTINGTNSLVASNGVFTSTVLLIEGENLITGVATDNANNTTILTKTVFIDTMAPDLTVNWPPDGWFTTENVVSVTGITDPDASLLINDVLVDVHEDGSFSSWILANTPGKNSITVLVSDQAGNEVEEKIVIWKPSILFLPIIVH